jgi:2,3-dihydroxybenzoate-AMP ligase
MKDWAGRLPDFPPAAVRRYRQAGLWGDRTIGREFHAVAAAYPGREAVVSREGRMTFAELDRRTDQVAAGLLGLGLEPGDPILFQVTNRLHSIVAWYGVLKAGLIPVATLAAHRRHEISQVSARTGAVAHLVEADSPGFDLVAFARGHQDASPAIRIVLTAGAAEPAPGLTRLEDLGCDADPAAARAAVEMVQASVDPDEVAVFQLSGGTTGVPKVIPRRHAEYWYNARAYASRLGWDEQSRVAHLIPVIHNAGILCGVHGPHSVGACLLLGTPDATASLPLLINEKVTDILVGHAHYDAVADRGVASLAGSVSRMVLSGTKVPPELFSKIEALGVWSGQLFGMAEGFCALTEPSAPPQARLATVGTPLSELDEFRILSPGSEEELPDGVTGELCCRGPYTLPGYFDDAGHNAVAFTADGFYRTGDLATVITLGGTRYLSIDGRIKDVINRGGEKINAEEVELLLLRHPAVAQAAVVAMPDPRLGERSCACLVAEGRPLSLDEIREHLAALGVAKFKWPERVEWTDALPRSNIGKVDKRALRERIAAAVARDSAASSRARVAPPR